MEPCTCDIAHPWGIGKTISGTGPVILWNLVGFHSAEDARAYADQLNREKAKGSASYFAVDMHPKKGRVTS